MAIVKIFLTSRDTMQVTQMASDLKRWHGVTEIVIVDCGSTFRPLLRWLDDPPPMVRVIRTNNHGPRAPWKYLEWTGEPYAVSDGDLDLSGLPYQSLTILADRLKAQPALAKVGLALRIDDLPATVIGDAAQAHEMQFWTRPTSDGFYSADIDTTFAVYRDPGWGGYGPAERCGHLAARHVPWYLSPPYPADWQHYFAGLDSKFATHWSHKLAALEVDK